MKFLMMLLTTILATGSALQAQVQDDLAKIQAVVVEFTAAGDAQDADKFEAILHPEFRTVANRQLGAAEVSLLSKSLYVELIRTRKIGGDQRKLFITQLNVVGNNATVKAEMHGKALDFTTFLSLVKSADGTWTIVGDFPHITLVEDAG